MARMLVRNQLNNGWIDISKSEVFVRDADNFGWVRLIPNEFSMRNQNDSGWTPIDDKFDPDLDSPCVSGFGNYGDCFGSETDTGAGSGDGSGSGGPAFDQVLGYPAGYDLPDCRYAGFYLSDGDMYPVGKQIRRPKLKADESYDPIGLASFAGLGSYANPNVLYASVHSRGAKITETVYRCGQVDGVLELLFASYGAGVSVDAYYMGVRVATTCGTHVGRGKLAFDYAPSKNGGEERIMIRVRGSEQSFWSLMVAGVKYPVKVITPTKVLTSLSISGTSSLNENSNSTYTATAWFNDGTTEVVTAAWSLNVAPSSAEIDNTGKLSVGALSGNSLAVVKAAYELDGVQKSDTKAVTLLDTTVPRTLKFGVYKKALTKAEYDAAFLAALNMPIAVRQEDYEYRIHVAPNTTTDDNRLYCYVAIPKEEYGYGYFRQMEGETYSFAGSWDGAAAFDDSTFDGGIEVVIDKQNWVVYRNDFPFNGLDLNYSIVVHASTLVSGLP